MSILKKESVWIFPKITLLIAVSSLLFILLRLGYMPSDIYSISFRIWLIAYFIFGATVFKRYLIGSVHRIIFKVGAHYVKEPRERRKLRRSTYLYSRIFEYAVYLLAILASINLFLNLQVVWNAIGTTFTLVITFFIGLMTSSVLGNLIAYEVIRQTDAISQNDVIGLKDDVCGDVVGIGAFLTRVKTVKNEIVTIPNLDLVSNMVKNYSRENPLIIHVPVGLGYDIEKNTAKKLLLEAAGKTMGVLTEPPPFVLLLELGSYSITYEVNVYTNRPHDLISIKSHLIENIIDEFRENGVEIISPQYTILRMASSEERSR